MIAGVKRSSFLKMSKEFHEIFPGLDDWHIFGPYLSFGVVPIRQPADTAKKQFWHRKLRTPMACRCRCHKNLIFTDSDGWPK